MKNSLVPGPWTQGAQKYWDLVEEVKARREAEWFALRHQPASLNGEAFTFGETVVSRKEVFEKNKGRSFWHGSEVEIRRAGRLMALSREFSRQLRENLSQTPFVKFIEREVESAEINPYLGGPPEWTREIYHLRTGMMVLGDTSYLVHHTHNAFVQAGDPKIKIVTNDGKERMIYVLKIMGEVPEPRSGALAGPSRWGAVDLSNTEFSAEDITVYGPKKAFVVMSKLDREDQREWKKRAAARQAVFEAKCDAAFPAMGATARPWYNGMTLKVWGECPMPWHDFKIPILCDDARGGKFLR